MAKKLVSLRIVKRIINNKTNTDMSAKKNSTNMVAIVTMCFIFAMISFVTNMAAPFGVIWGNQY